MEAQLKCNRLHHDALLPTPAGSHSVNIHAYLRSESGHPTKWVLPVGVTRLIPTGLHIIPSPPYAAMLLTHVYMAGRGINVLNPIPQFPHELGVYLHNAGREAEWIEHEDPIAQLILIELPTPIIVE